MNEIVFCFLFFLSWNVLCVWINFIFWVIWIIMGDMLATILVKNLPEDLLKELRRLKVELGCRTWAELLARLVESEEEISLSEEKLKEIRAGVRGFLKLKSVVSSRWTYRPTVLEEVRRSRDHEAC